MGFRLGELAAGLCELSLGLVDDGLKRARVDFEENVVLVDERAFAVILLYEVAGDLGLNVGIDVAIESSDPIAVDGDILLLDRDDNYI